MIPRTDPDHWRDLADRKAEACRAFRAREISLDVFRASLFSLGFRGAALETEVNLNWPSSPILHLEDLDPRKEAEAEHRSNLWPKA